MSEKRYDTMDSRKFYQSDMMPISELSKLVQTKISNGASHIQFFDTDGGIQLYFYTERDETETEEFERTDQAQIREAKRKEERKAMYEKLKKEFENETPTIQESEP